MKPIFKVGDHDYTAFLAEDGLSPSRNDLDADGSGRNIINGKMFRSRVAQKDKWTVKFLRLPELIVKSLAVDIDPEFVEITILHPKTNRHMTKTYYTSTLNYGNQKYAPDQGITVYDGVTFDITER